MTTTDNKPVIGQVIESMGNQITVPEWMVDYHNTPTGLQGVRKGYSPCIRVAKICDEWRINTGMNNSGLVCFVPEQYQGMAVLSVRITKVLANSVVAEPLEWIEVSPKLDMEWRGVEGEAVENFYKERIEHGNINWKFEWHGR